MPKARKKKRPIVSLDSTRTESATATSSRTLIRQFHVLLKKKAQLQNNSQLGDAKALADIERDIETLGGLSAYQRMSSIGQGMDRGGGSEKVAIGWLKQLGLSDKLHGAKQKLRLLEVGALKPDNYQSCSSWVNCTPIDLRSRHPDITEQDFLLMKEEESLERWDVISLSLVMNFVPEAKARGRMLYLAHSMLSREGLLFLALPLPCLSNSRYLTFDHLKALMGAIGFIEVNARWKMGGKMAYWLYRKSERHSDIPEENFRKKVVLRKGNRNNFCILL